MSTSLVSTQNRVESPFIIVKIGDYTFGGCTKTKESKNAGALFRVTFPNYVTSINVTKVNGAVNIYTINLTYVITQADDPNRIDKILSSVANTREITLTYGDWNAPAFIYREEKAIITKVTENVDFKSAKITYTLKCTSTALALQSIKGYFPAKKAKPSDEIMRLLKDESTGLQDIFSGMRNLTTVATNNFIARDDKVVQLDRKDSISILDYIAYLVSCMESVSDTGGALKSSLYYWAVYDDTSNKYGGSYFMVRRVDAGCKYNISYNTYEVDVGYPTSNYVTQFSVNSDDSWSILYNYSKKVNQPEYVYTISDDGVVESTYSPSVTGSAKTLVTSSSSKDWWSKMTQFPITAKLTIRGLLRPAMLMSNVKVNSYFYGHKHITSGLYIITKQEDTIDSSGYKTTLSLTRISGDEEFEKGK